MPERTDLVTQGGNPVTLVGNAVSVGDAAPDVTLLDIGVKPVALSSFHGKVVVLASVPSLDTGVCDTEGRRFNAEAANLSDDVAVVIVSMDLPFAQKRWCGAAGVEAVTTLSDHRSGAFGEAFGVAMKGARLLARTVFVLDREGVVRYVQIVPEVGQEPDYEAILGAVKELL
ncbi:MAG: thiol peroxidase [Planctomycetota bacterium]|jgi:thiol peroxidase